MKIQAAKILFDKSYFNSGEKLTGKVSIETQDGHWSKNGKVFLKLYDKLDIEWTEDEMISVGVTQRSYNNFQKPFQLNMDILLDKSNCVIVEDDSIENFKFEYPFEFQLPTKLQGTLYLKHAKCQYFIKAYLTNDESVSKHYIENVNVFDELFKILNHTYAKEEITIYNRKTILPVLSDHRHVVEAKSPHYHVTVSLPKIQFNRDETIDLRVIIQHAPKEDGSFHRTELEVHKVGFKLFQVIKLTSRIPRERTRLFDVLLSHSSRKHLKENTGESIVLEEFIPIPNDIASSSSRSVEPRQTSNSEQSLKQYNPIRVNYKISLEFWRNFLIDELDINIPILIDPEA